MALMLGDVGAPGAEGRPRTRPWAIPTFKASGKGVPHRGQWELSRSHAGGGCPAGPGEGGAQEGLVVQSEGFPAPVVPGP